MKKLSATYSLFCSSIVHQLNKNEENKSESTLARRSELPIYSETPHSTDRNLEETGNPKVLGIVKIFRTEACKLARNAQSISDRCERFVNTGIAHSYSNYVTTVEYLQEEKNLLSRIGAITGGVLFGYVFSMRRGFLKRLFYMSSGGIVAAVICYPNESSEYFQKSLQSSKKYTIIGYHFLNGVAKDLGGFELPTFPLKILTSESQETVKKEESKAK